MDKVHLAVSTPNGCHILTNDGGWRIGSHVLVGESVNNVIMAKSGKLVASTLTDGVYVSSDGRNWKASSRGLHVRKVWTVEEDRHKGSLYAGTQYGHLFKSSDGGESWEEVTGLFKAPNRNKWGVDWGFGTTGLTIHTVKSDPFSAGRLYIIASGNGVYRTDDGGDTWRLLRRGLMGSCPVASRRNAPETPSGDEAEQMSTKEHLRRVHACSHKLVLSSSREGYMFQQNHCGVYMSGNSGERWRDISPNEDMRHGFAIGVTSRDRIFVVPAYQGICKEHLSCIRGQLKVLTTGNDGKTWEQSTHGLPKSVHTCVLRDCVAVTRDHPAGVFFGTTTGEVYYSPDEGGSWQIIMRNAGRIQGISVLAAS